MSICFENTENAILYNENSSLQFIWAFDMIDKYNDIILSSNKIIDIGCGDGKITSILAEKSNVIGLDLNEAMIEIAKNKYPNINFIVKDVNNINYNNEFDLVFSSCCLQWLPDQKQALINIKNSLINKGKILIIIPGKDNLFPLGKNISQTEKWSKYFTKIEYNRSYYSDVEYILLLNEIGLDPISVKTSSTEIIFKDINKLRNWIKPICVYYEYLPNELKDDFLNDELDYLIINHCYKKNNDIILKSIKQEIYAIKN